MKNILIFLYIFLSCFNIQAKEGPINTSMMVRVAILRDITSVDLAVEGEFRFKDLSSNNTLLESPRLALSKVRLLENSFFINGQNYETKELLIDPATDASIRINDRRFRGQIILVRTSPKAFLVVNVIDIEDYTKGVLYHEVSPHWPIEALKAQAVATRTYAIYKIRSGKNKNFDLTNDIYSQVYGGRESERYRTGLAVDKTVNQVLAFQGKILPSYFHATCAGMTEDVSQLWDVDMIPLKGIACNYCNASPHKRWKINMQLKDIQAKLNKSKYKIGLIKNIEILSRNKSGRITRLRITSRDGGKIVITGKDFRELMGPNILKSNNYDIVMLGFYVDFIGQGWGHGVGMCQWGARGMALNQFNFKQILNYYYPRADLINYQRIIDVNAKPSSK